VRIASLQDGLASSRPVRAARVRDWDTFWVMSSRLHPILLAHVVVSLSCTSNGSVSPLYSIGVEKTGCQTDGSGLRLFPSEAKTRIGSIPDPEIASASARTFLARADAQLPRGSV
jgi:hypothetical protein